MNDFLRVAVILLLVVGNGLFVAAEYALVTARRPRLEALAQAGNRRAERALRLMDNPVGFISTVQVGITALSILIGAVGQPLLETVFEPWLATFLSFLLAFAILTYLSLVIGELVPKALALQKAERLALALAVPVAALQRVTAPLVWLLERSSHGILRVFGIQPAPAGIAAHSEEDIRHIVAAAEDTGVIETSEEEMLYKVFDFADKEAHEVMVPRPEVTALSVDLPPQECLAAVIDSPYTRYPVYRGSMDDILGLLHVRDLFSAMWEKGLEAVRVEDLVRPALVVPETKDLAALLAEFRRQNQHLALVIDEYGGFQGIVTLEDVLEEIVGEIEDEYDLPDESIEQLENGRIRIDGTFPIDDFNEQFGRELPQEDYHTLAGFVFGQIGRQAEAGDEVVWDGLRFQVVTVEGPRIERLEIEFLEEEPEADAEAAPA